MKLPMQQHLAVVLLAPTANASGQNINQCRGATAEVTLQHSPCKGDAKADGVSNSISPEKCQVSGRRALSAHAATAPTSR